MGAANTKKLQEKNAERKENKAKRKVEKRDAEEKKTEERFKRNYAVATQSACNKEYELKNESVNFSQI